jgi:hypothetical protein
MLMTERRTVRTTVTIDPAEQYAIEVVDFIAESLLEMLEDNKKTEMMNFATGEIIDTDDLRRFRGILQGISHCKEWVLE